MKKTIYASIITLFVTSYSIAGTHSAECEKITGVLKTGEKIDCMLNLKKLNKDINTSKSNVKKNITKILDKNTPTPKTDSLNTKKKKFDEKNKTLWKMYKNMTE